MITNIIVVDPTESADEQAKAFTIAISHQDVNLNVQNAVKAACEEFIKTPRGNKIYNAFGHKLPWTAFLTSVPNDICKNHGFEKFDVNDTDMVVNALKPII